MVEVSDTESTSSGVPHSLQNRASAGLTDPQLGHFMAALLIDIGGTVTA